MERPFLPVHGIKLHDYGIWKGIKSGFPDSPLAGGTVAGFITQEGCYTRGVAAFALDYPNMEVTIGIGHNTKRNPEKAADECVKMIKKYTKPSKWNNKFLLTLVSGTEIPQIPGVGRAVIKSATISSHAL